MALFACLTRLCFAMGGCPVHWRIFRGNSGFCSLMLLAPLCASSSLQFAPPPQLWQLRGSQNIPQCPMGTEKIPLECVLWLLEGVSISIAEKKNSYVCDYPNPHLGSSSFILEDQLSNLIIFHFSYLLWHNSTDRWQLLALASFCMCTSCVNGTGSLGDGVFQMVK